MKKILTLVLAGAIALSNGAFGLAAETETVTIKLAHNMDFVTIPEAIVKAAENLNAKYEAEGSNVRIEIEKDYQRIDAGEYMQNVVFATKNGEGPDIFLFAGSLPEQVKSGLVMELDMLDTSKFVDGCFDSCMVDGKIYMFPFDVPTRTLYYRKDVLKELGWTDEEITAFPEKMADGSFTWEQFIELCCEAQEKGIVEWGMLHRPGAGNDFFDILRVFGGTHYTEDGVLCANKEGLIRYFQFMYDAANVMGITPTDTTQRVWTDLQAMVGDGRAFSYYGPVFSSTYVAAEVGLTPEELAEQVGFVAYPVSEYNDQPFSIAAPQGVSINANTEHPEICKALLEEVYAGDAVKELAVHGATTFSLTSVKEANTMDEIVNHPVLNTLTCIEDCIVTIPPMSGDALFRSELYKQITLLELGQTTPEKAYEEFKIQLELNLDEDEIVFVE